MQLDSQIDEVRAAQDTVGNEKASIEKQNRTLQAQLSDVQRKCDEANLILGDYDNAKKKVVIENADLLRQVQCIEGVLSHGGFEQYLCWKCHHWLNEVVK